MPFTSSILITGGTTGLGYETAISLSKSQPSAQIIIASRSNGSAASTINSLTSNSPPNVIYLPLDLSTHSATRTFVSLFETQNFPPISALILNAGIQVVDGVRFAEEDNLEFMFAVNHVNHALLFFLIKKHLMPEARIVIISSSTHDPKFKRVPPPDYTTGDAAAHPPATPKNKYGSRDEAMRRYALSKLCNVLFAYALARHAREANKGWTVLTLDPGVMPTQLYRWATGAVGATFKFVLSSWVGRTFIKDTFTAEFSARTLARLAVDAEFGGEGRSGKYFQVREGKEVESSMQSYDVKRQEDLWEWTIGEVAGGGEEAEEFKAL